MKAFRNKPGHPTVKLHYHNFIFSKKKIKIFDFEGFFHLSGERGQTYSQSSANSTNYVDTD